MKRVCIPNYICLLVILIFCIQCSYAGPEYLIKETFKSNENYLNPVYEVLLKGTLEKNDRSKMPIIWMYANNVFTNPYAVVLYKRTEYKRENTGLITKVISPEVKSGDYFIEYIYLKEKLRKKNSTNDNDLNSELQKHLILKRVYSTNINLLDYQFIIHAWKKALENAKKEPLEKDPSDITTDGSFYVFYAEPNLFGSALSPGKGIPIMMHRVGNILKDIATTSEEFEKDKLLSQGNSHALNIVNEIESNGVRLD